MSEQQISADENKRYLASLDVEDIAELKSSIIVEQNAIKNEAETLLKRWNDNQRLKRICNAVSSVITPQQNEMTIGDDFIDFLTIVFGHANPPRNIPTSADNPVDLSKVTDIKIAISVVMKLHNQPLLINKILEDLETFNFGGKRENRYQNVRATLVYNSTKKKYFLQDNDKKWYFTVEGKKFLLREADVSTNLTNACLTHALSANITDVNNSSMIDEPHTQRDQSGRFTSSPSSNSKKRSADIYADLMLEFGNRENGKIKMHAREIAALFNKKYYKSNANAHDIGHTLRKNSNSTNPVVRKLGDNEFELIDQNTEIS